MCKESLHSGPGHGRISAPLSFLNASPLEPSQLMPAEDLSRMGSLKWQHCELTHSRRKHKMRPPRLQRLRPWVRQVGFQARLPCPHSSASLPHNQAIHSWPQLLPGVASPSFLTCKEGKRRPTTAFIQTTMCSETWNKPRILSSTNYSTRCSRFIRGKLDRHLPEITMYSAQKVLSTGNHATT